MKKVIFMTTLQLTLLTTPNISKACWGFCGDGFRVLPENNDDVKNTVNKTVEKAKDVYQDTVTFGQHGRDRQAQRSQLERQRIQQQQQSILQAEEAQRNYEIEKLDYLNSLLKKEEKNLRNYQSITYRLRSLRENYNYMNASYEEAISNLKRAQNDNQNNLELLNSVNEDARILYSQLSSGQNDFEDQVSAFDLLIKKSRRHNMSQTRYLSIVLAKLSGNESNYNKYFKLITSDLNRSINIAESAASESESEIQSIRMNIYTLSNKIYNSNSYIHDEEMTPPVPPAQ